MKDGLKFFTDLHWPVIGLVIFFATFGILVVIHSRFYSPKMIEKLSQLPFDGENHE